VKDRFERSDGVVVRRCASSEFARFDGLLDEHHWLGRGLFGATVRRVTEIDGEWVALVGWGSPAFRVGHRDRFIGWSREQQNRRLRHVVNNNGSASRRRAGLETSPPRFSRVRLLA